MGGTGVSAVLQSGVHTVLGGEAGQEWKEWVSVTGRPKFRLLYLDILRACERPGTEIRELTLMLKFGVVGLLVMLVACRAAESGHEYLALEASPYSQFVPSCTDFFEYVESIELYVSIEPMDERSFGTGYTIKNPEVDDDWHLQGDSWVTHTARSCNRESLQNRARHEITEFKTPADAQAYVARKNKLIDNPGVVNWGPDDHKWWFTGEEISELLFVPAYEGDAEELFLTLALQRGRHVVFTALPLPFDMSSADSLEEWFTMMRVEANWTADQLE